MRLSFGRNVVVSANANDQRFDAGYMAPQALLQTLGAPLFPVSGHSAGIQ